MARSETQKIAGVIAEAIKKSSYNFNKKRCNILNACQKPSINWDYFTTPLVTGWVK